MKTHHLFSKFMMAFAALLTVVACGSSSNNTPAATTCYTPTGTAYTCGDGAYAYEGGYQPYSNLYGVNQTFGGGFINSGYGYGNGLSVQAIHCVGEFMDVYGNVGLCGPMTRAPFCIGYQMRTLTGMPVYCAY